MRLPAAAPIFLYAERQLARPSLQNLSLPGAAPGRRANFRGRGRQAMHLPCKQADAGALPADSTISLCGENEIQASLINSASVGATPTPATIPSREMIQLPDCKSGVVKQNWK